MDDVTTIAIAAGSLVRPVDTFDFEAFGGPASLTDRGLVLEVSDAGNLPEGHGTLILVAWAESGVISDHVSADHTGHPDDDFNGFGVVALTPEEVEATIEDISERQGLPVDVIKDEIAEAASA